MKKSSQELRFKLFVFGVPLLLVIFWAGKDCVDLTKNYIRIWKLKIQIVQMEKLKSEIEKEITLLKKNDPVTVEQALRAEFNALRPNEVEYRINK